MYSVQVHNGKSNGCDCYRGLTNLSIPSFWFAVTPDLTPEARYGMMRSEANGYAPYPVWVLGCLLQTLSPLANTTHFPEELINQGDHHQCHESSARVLIQLRLLSGSFLWFQALLVMSATIVAVLGRSLRIWTECVPSVPQSFHNAVPYGQLWYSYSLRETVVDS